MDGVEWGVTGRQERGKTEDGMLKTKFKKMLQAPVFIFHLLLVCCDGNWCFLPHASRTRALLKLMRPNEHGLNLLEVSAKVNPPYLVFPQVFYYRKTKITHTPPYDITVVSGINSRNSTSYSRET